VRSVTGVLIPWTDIAGFKVYQVQRQKFLVVLLLDPEKYLARSNPVARTLKRMSLKMSGSPITISSNSLQINFDSLTNLCSEYFQRYGSRPQMSDSATAKP
jgi:AraC-like DNA-binding protein